LKKKIPWSQEQQRRSDELTAVCNTLKALHELQGRLIVALENREPWGYGRGKVHTHVLYPEMFKQIVTAAEGMLSIAAQELKVWQKNLPINELGTEPEIPAAAVLAGQSPQENQ
jgi:hypothetical protein